MKVDWFESGFESGKDSGFYQLSIVLSTYLSCYDLTGSQILNGGQIPKPTLEFNVADITSPNVVSGCRKSVLDEIGVVVVVG